MIYYKGMEEKFKALHDSSTSKDVVSPPSPPSRHEKWKLARTKPGGQVQQSSQGSFVSKEKQDILTAAIDTQEHPGRVHTAGLGVGVRQFFGSTSQSSSSVTPATQDQLAKMREELK